MIIIRFLGGLGNQLFIYAFGRFLELKYNTEVFYDTVSGYRNDPYKRKYILDKFNTKIKKAAAYDSFYFPLNKRSSFLAQMFYPRSIYLNEKSFNSIESITKDNIKVYMEGYWQNPSYFNEFAGIIKEEFKIITPPPEENSSIRQLIENSESVGIHIRRINFNPVVPLQYYTDSIKEIGKNLSDPRFFCFSDDIDWCRNNLVVDREIYFVQNNDLLEDFRLLSMCKHFIISNSTFAWWAANLSDNYSKEIIYPPNNYWINKYLPETILSKQ